MNHAKTFILLAALTALFVGIGYMIGGPAGMAIAFVLAAGMNLVSYWNADKIVLSMYRAQPVDAGHPAPRIRAYVNDVTEMAAVLLDQTDQRLAQRHRAAPAAVLVQGIVTGDVETRCLGHEPRGEVVELPP